MSFFFDIKKKKTVLNHSCQLPTTTSNSSSAWLRVHPQTGHTRPNDSYTMLVPRELLVITVGWIPEASLQSRRLSGQLNPVICCENEVFKIQKNKMVLYTFVIFGLSPISWRCQWNQDLYLISKKNKQIKQAFYISIFQPLSWEPCMIPFGDHTKNPCLESSWHPWGP